MAPYTLRPSYVELHESEVTKPSPLRIIKRNKTTTGSSSSRETFGGRRGTSGESNESMGTPPGGDRPLTVRKRRTTRASVSDWGLDSPLSDKSPGNLNLARVNNDGDGSQEDPDLTPKANPPMARTISAGAFLKSELHRRSIDIEAGRYSVRGHRHPGTPVLGNNQAISSRCPIGPPKEWSPTIPERRPSKSKGFFLRAIAGRSEESKGLKRSDSTLSKNVLRRRLSKSKSKFSGSSDSSHENSVSSASTEAAFAPESFDIADVGINSRLSSCETPSSYSMSDTTSFVSNQGPLILSPQITITPEVSSVDNGNCELWVAVEITGTLYSADGRKRFESSPCRSSSRSSAVADYGRLHSMEINLSPSGGCQLSSIIGNVHQVPTINAHETHLVLAKIKLGKVNLSRHVKEASSADLIAELETDLGDSVTSYLTVRITYNHSGFPSLTNPGINTEGLSSHATQLQTEATAVIRRHNSQSAWSPRTSQTMADPLGTNPLINLIETHFSPVRARETIKRLADERPPIPMAKRFQHLPGSSEETVKPARTAGNDTSSQGHCPQDMSGNITFPQEPFQDDKQAEEIDPARRIWSEMRRNSGYGRHRRPRTSLSADHFYSVDEDNSSPTISAGIGGKKKGSEEIDHIRSNIKSMALRNKRSIGADTVNSFVPSIGERDSSPVGKGKGGGFGAIGIGLNRGWQPWWNWGT